MCFKLSLRLPLGYIGEGNGTVRISVYDKREDFNFKIVTFP